MASLNRVFRGSVGVTNSFKEAGPSYRSCSDRFWHRLSQVSYAKIMDTQSNVKKMILVDQNSLERMRSTPTPALNRASALDDEMQRVMDKPNLSDHERWAAYNELLQRYLGLKQEARQPVSIPILETSRSAANAGPYPVSNQPDPVLHQLISAVPKSHAKKAQLLYNLLKRNAQHITWNDAGECTINGSLLRGSNITDLISDVIRTRKNFQPLYHGEFAKVLSLVNAPQDLIGNSDRWKLVLRSRLSNNSRFLPDEYSYLLSRSETGVGSRRGSSTEEDEGAVGFTSSTPRWDSLPFK